MRLGLTNTIAARGTPVGGDGLALDLQFAADKTLTARKGPTPVLTRGSTGTFVGSNGLIQTAAVNAARFDHDPVTLASRGLLIEEGRTNLLVQSENFGTTWLSVNLNQTGTPPYLNVATAPDGTTTADKLIENTASGGHGVDQSVTFTAAAHTFSVYAKAAERSWLRMTLAILGNNTWFDVANGTVGTIGAGVTASIQNAGNGWWRCSVTVTATAGSLQNFIRIATGNNNTTYVGDGTSGILVWGAQIEAGAFATSYIPTTTSTLARSADVCSITGANFTNLWNASEGTMLVNSFTPASGDRTVVSADDNTSNEMIRLRTEGTNPFFKVTDGGSELVAIDSGTVVANTVFKLAGAYKLNDFASSINGGVAVTDTTGTVPTVDRMRIGAGQGGNTMCGCVSSMRYYKKRLSDSKIQTLTV